MSGMSGRAYLVAATVLALAGARASGAQAATNTQPITKTISTLFEGTGPVPPSNSYPWAELRHSGAEGITSVAQTFVAPAGTPVLTEFQFWLRDIDEFGSQTFRGYIFEWAGDRITGPILYQSLPRAGTDWEGSSVLYTFESNPFLLKVDQTYAAVLSPVGFVPDRGTIGGVFLEEANRYAPFGQAWEVSSGNSEGIEGLRSRPWTARERADDNGVPPDELVPGRDFSFTATFRDDAHIFPEPGTWVLVATGLAGVAGMARWRARHG